MDALRIAFAIELPSAVCDELRARQDRANACGTAEVTIGAFTGALSHASSVDRWIIKNDDVTCEVNARAAEGWTLAIDVRAHFLATHALDEVIAFMQRIARCFGCPTRSRVRRLDLAVDVLGWKVRSQERTSFLLPRGQGGKARWSSHHKGDNMTGFVCCAGAPLLARIYNKVEELQSHRDERKSAIEMARWRAAGWTDGEAVTRVEFQLRSETLEELAVCSCDLRTCACARGQLRDPARLAAALDGVWQYLTTRWLRLTIPNSATRDHNRKTDPRWDLVQGVRFAHEIVPVRRVRRRGGATVAQALGTTMSSLAANGRLARIELDGFDRERAYVDSLADRDMVIGFITRVVVTVCLTQAMHTIDDLLSEAALANRSPRDVAEKLATQLRGMHARFSSSMTSGVFEPPMWTAMPQGEGFFLTRTDELPRVA